MSIGGVLPLPDSIDDLHERCTIHYSYKIGAYFCLDIPAVLKEQIIDHLMAHHSYSRAELYYSLLYTVYNMPNMVLPLLGGFFTDKFGDRSMTIIFTLFVTLG